MFYKKLMLVAVCAMLGAGFAREASAWGTGGAVIGTGKSTGYNLFCDLSRTTFGSDTILPADQFQIETHPTVSDPAGTQPSITLHGDMYCAEVIPGQTGLENAQPPFGVGRFTLNQISPIQRPTSHLTQTETGLIYSGPDANGVRTWTFQVPDSPGFVGGHGFPELLYELVPANDSTRASFCGDSSTQCKALFGLQIPANKADYAARDLDGDHSNDLSDGQVFTFSTITTNGLERAGKLYWGPCHSQAFIVPKPVIVDATANGSGSGGTGAATGVHLDINNNFAVTANQNDLWNSGNCDPHCRWSNADGQIRLMTDTGHDDATGPDPRFGITHSVGDEIGIDWPSKLSGNLLAFNSNGQWLTATEAAYGTLVGRAFDDHGNPNGPFFILGTAFDGRPPYSGDLKLYYWDTPLSDNTDFITATVADKSIQCAVVQNGNEVPATAGNTRGFLPVTVGYSPSPLNVSNTSNTATFPAFISHSATLTFSANGSPIIDPGGLSHTQAFVNGSPVTLFSFQVASSDLKLKLSNLDVIRAVTPGGKCPIAGQDVQNVIARLEIGSAANGFFAGESTITLKNCLKLPL